MTTPPALGDWIVTGNELIAWINDLEFFDITPTPKTGTFGLRINHLALAATVYLGESDTVVQATQRAQQHLATEPDPTLTCVHGHDMLQDCPDCQP